MNQNELLSHFAASVPGFMYSFNQQADGHGFMLYASAGIRDIFGLAPEDVARDLESLNARIHPRDLAGFTHPVVATLACEFRVNHPQKGELRAEARATPKPGPDGSMIWHGFITDITERKKLEDALRHSQERLIEIQRIGQMGSWEMDWMSGAMVWSEEVYCILEIDPALFSASYDAFMKAIYPDDREVVSNAYSESLKSRTSCGIEHRLLFADGRIKCVRECWSTYYDENGKPVRSLGTIQDITERKLLERQLAKREQEFRTLAENSPDIIVRYDRDCCLAYANPVFEKYMGLRLDELRGKKPTQIPDFPEVEMFQRRVREVIETGKRVEFEHYVLLKGGMTDWRLVSIIPECDMEGRIAYVQVLSRNITSLKESELHLKQSHARLRELLVYQANSYEWERKQVSWNMHEELLQNLASVNMYVMLLKSRSAELPAYLVNMLPSMISGLEKSTLLVRELVNTLRPTVLNLGIHAALEWLADEFVKHPDRRCKLEIDEDETQLDEHSCLVIFRVVQKSLEAIAKYGGAAKVNISLECNKSDCLLVMRDNNNEYNINMSDSNFLSLTAMQELVLDKGGEMAIFSALDLFSAPGKGLIIQVHLPVQGG